MKLINSNFLGIALLLFCFITGLYGQGANHIIILAVDTENLDSNDPAAACSFGVADETITEVLDRSSAKNFTILVQSDDFVEWEGVTTSGEEIDIEMIEYREVGNSINIFNGNRKRGRNENGSKKKVKQKVKGNAKGKEYSYAIEFSVAGEMYQFDPKIKVE